MWVKCIDGSSSLVTLGSTYEAVEVGSSSKLYRVTLNDGKQYDLLKSRFEVIEEKSFDEAAWFAAMLADCRAPTFAQRAAIKICRNLHIVGDCDPSEIANLIAIEAAKDGR